MCTRTLFVFTQTGLSCPLVHIATFASQPEPQRLVFKISRLLLASPSSLHHSLSLDLRTYFPKYMFSLCNLVQYFQTILPTQALLFCEQCASGCGTFDFLLVYRPVTVRWSESMVGQNLFFFPGHVLTIFFPQLVCLPYRVRFSRLSTSP